MIFESNEIMTHSPKSFTREYVGSPCLGKRRLKEGPCLMNIVPEMVETVPGGTRIMLIARGVSNVSPIDTPQWV